VSSFGIFNRKALPSFTVTDSTLHIWNGKTVDGEDAVCINGFAYHKDLIFDDRLLVPMTGVRADERGPGPGAVPLRAVRCNRL
jgi:hypothetical protein